MSVTMSARKWTPPLRSLNRLQYLPAFLRHPKVRVTPKCKRPFQNPAFDPLRTVADDAIPRQNFAFTAS